VPPEVRTLKIGLSIIANPVAVARKAEELGFESIWLGEHPFIPVQHRAYPELFEDGKVPEFYSRLTDPLIGLACAGAVTDTIKLATGICLLPYRNVFFLAKEIATLDRLSRGRVIIGAGAGFLEEEAAIFGVPFGKRWQKIRETVEAMRELWTKDDAEYHGEMIGFPAVRCLPHPVQKPYPPVLVGAVGERALRRVAAWGDGWVPSGPNVPSPEQLRADLARLRELCEVSGRDFGALDITVYVGVAGFGGVADTIRRYEDAGAGRVVLYLSTAQGAETFGKYRGLARGDVDEVLEDLAEAALGRAG
jgi:probable F420-dependent oxidoreductase